MSFEDGSICFSLLTSKLTSLFTLKLLETFPELNEHIENNPPCFDCRVFNFPSLSEAVNEVVWRERDCTKNSVSMLARHYYSHKELQGKSRNEMLDMIVEKGDNWNSWGIMHLNVAHISVNGQ